MKKIIPILSIFFLLISLFVVPSAAESSDTVLLEAGTYVLNDVLTGIGDYDNHSINFKMDVDASGTSLTIDCFAIDQSQEPGVQIAYHYDGSSLGGSVDQRTYVYDSQEDPCWRFGLYGDSINILRTTEDQYIDSVLAGWIARNTVAPSTSDYIIYPGIYRARDSFIVDLSLLPSAGEFEFESAYSDLVNDGLDYHALFFVEDNLPNGLKRLQIEYLYLGDDGIYENIWVYFDNQWYSDDYKEIRIYEPAYVSEDFYLMFGSVFEYVDNSGYDVGYRDGYSEGYDKGYLEGYSQGYENADTGVTWFGDIIGDALSALDKFVIFGNFSLLDLYSSILGVFALTWLLKLLAGG